MEMNSEFQEFSGKRCVVTGGLGFIGSHVVKSLARVGARVTAIDSMVPEYGGNLANLGDHIPGVRLNFSDVRDSHSMRYLISDADYLFNLAGQSSHLDSMNSPVTDLEINSLAQLSILESCRMHNPDIRIVFAATRQIYGTPRYLPVDENHPIEPVDINGVNKFAGENFHTLYWRIHGIKTTSLRLTNTYGPGMRVKDSRQTFLGTWIKAAVSNELFQVFGDGSQIRDFNFVSDVVRAILLAAIREPAVGRVMNLAGDERFSLIDVAKLLVEIAGSGSYNLVDFPADRKKIDIGDYYGDYSLAGELLDWRPAVSLSTGLEETVAYYRSHISAYL